MIIIIGLYSTQHKQRGGQTFHPYSAITPLRNRHKNRSTYKKAAAARLCPNMYANNNKTTQSVKPVTDPAQAYNNAAEQASPVSKCLCVGFGD